MRQSGTKFVRCADTGCAIVLFGALSSWVSDIVEFKQGHVVTFGIVLWTVAALLARR